MLYCQQFDGLVQETRNSIANALELYLSSTNPSNFTADEYFMWSIYVSLVIASGVSHPGHDNDWQLSVA